MGSGIAATAGTDHLATTAPVGCLNNGGTEHGPLGLNVPRLPPYMVESLPEVEVYIYICIFFNFFLFFLFLIV